MSNVSRQLQRRFDWFIRSAAAFGALVSGAFLPVALVGVAAGASNLFSSPRYGWITVPLDLWFLSSGLCGVLGFAGFTAYALLPTRVFTRHSWVKRVVVTGLLCGVFGVCIIVLPGVTTGAVSFGHFEYLLSSLALPGCSLARALTANPSIERTSSGKLRLPAAAAHVKR